MTLHPFLTPVALLLASLGLVLAASGAWVLWADGARKRFGPSTSEPTRHVIGMSLLLGGYHLIAYVVPDAWVPLKVPRDRWFLVPAVICVALAISWVSDRLLRMSPDGNDPPPEDRNDRNIL